MFFNEIYGTYYNTMAVVIEAARSGKLDDEMLFKIVRENSFAESVVPITDAVREEKYQLVTSDFKTKIKNKPEMPLTDLQKKFLKSMLLDKRANLFFSEEEISELQNDLSDVEPIFNPDDIERFDQYADGDDFESPDYIKNFRTILEAIHKKQKIKIHAIGRNGLPFEMSAVPEKFEYSAKDDKFRICFSGKSKYSMLNMAKVERVVICKTSGDTSELNSKHIAIDKKTELVLEVTDERNALDRILINFSHLKKSCEKIDDNRYRLSIEFDESDFAEMIIRILQFGPYVKAVEPEWFVERIREKLRRQKRIR